MRSGLVELIIGVVLGALVFAAPGLAAQPTPNRSLVLTTRGADSKFLKIVDPDSLQIIASMPIGPDSHEVGVSADGRMAFTANNGSGRLHEINIVDLVEQKTLPSLDTKALLGPHGLVVVGGKVWFTAEGAKAIARYDPTRGEVDWIMGTGQNRTHMLSVTPDQKRIYATSVDSGTVNIFDFVELPPLTPPTRRDPPPGAPNRMEWVQTVIPLAIGVEGFDVSPDGRELWTAEPVDGRIYIVDTQAKQRKGVIDSKILGASRVRFTPDGGRVVISSLFTGELFVYDAKSHREIKRAKVCTGATTLLMDAQRPRVFVACLPDTYLVVFDLEKLEATSRIETGRGPDGLDWAVRP